MPATKDTPKKSDNLFVFISNKKYSLAYSNDIKSLEVVSAMGKKSFFFYFTGKSKNETQSTLISIGREMSKQGRTPKILGYTDGSILSNTLNKTIQSWNVIIREDTKAIQTDKIKQQQADKEKKK